MLCGSSGSRLQYLLSWWQMCIFQQCWLQILKYQLEMPSEIISHLNILVFLVTHSHVWHPKLCWDLLRALSKEHRVQSPAPAGYCITQAAKSGTLSCVCCCSQQRHHNRQRLAQVLDNPPEESQFLPQSAKGGSTKLASWDGRGWAGAKLPVRCKCRRTQWGANLDWTSLCWS